VTYLSALAAELDQLAGVLGSSGTEIAQASRELGLADTHRVGPADVDTAADAVVAVTSTGLGQVAAALAEVESVLQRLATSASDSVGGP